MSYGVSGQEMIFKENEIPLCGFRKGCTAADPLSVSAACIAALSATCTHQLVASATQKWI